MSNPSKDKGRKAERDAIEWLETLDWHVIDCHHNDSFESRTNADLLVFESQSVVPAGPKEAVEIGIDVQVKYTGANAYGVKALTEAHKDVGGLGKYRRPQGKGKHDLSYSDGHMIYWRPQVMFSCPADAIFAASRSPPFSPRYVIDKKRSSQLVDIVDEFKIGLVRYAGHSWIAIGLFPGLFLNQYEALGG